MNKKQKINLFMIFFVYGIPVVLLDQITKQIALAYLEVNSTPIPFIGNLISFQLVFNPGAAFSIASSYTWVFSIFPVFVLIVISIFGRNIDNNYWRLCLGALAGGAVGNLIDRITRMPTVFEGHVVDFINYKNYFVGNIADIAIVVAALGIIVLSSLGVPSKKPRHKIR